jgi:hypothetical protein
LFSFDNQLLILVRVLVNHVKNKIYEPKSIRIFHAFRHSV